MPVVQRMCVLRQSGGLSALTRCSCLHDAVVPLLEPAVEHDEPSPFWTETMTLVPATLVVRGRKDGV